MVDAISFLGFGEAAQAFAGDPRWRVRARGYDLKTDDLSTRAAKLNEFVSIGVDACENAATAVAPARVLLSVVTADRALEAARAASAHIWDGALYLDMNSVAPSTKRAAAAAIEARGGRYVDVAIMSPALPARLDAPLLLSGGHAEAAQTALRDVGFRSTRIAGAEIGRASQIKMVRSVLIKGIEAVTAECLLAAHAGGVLEEVLASLETAWAQRANYNLERVLAHGVRRAAEMEEVAHTLRDLGVEPITTEAAIARQRALGSLGLVPAPEALSEKLARIESALKASAA